ncbi:MAG: Si-specific NAD(P)(+) transhydrogenase [candidate division Zixibacteria bacterium]|nr:Si-specific NAD(P)(+) transhydrogenase [candidate division Zixibacteria bacterium]
MEQYDLIVIGSGPAGEKAAIQAAQNHKRTAVIETRGVVGGVCVHTGTLPSKTLRETVLYLAGLKQRSVYGVVCTVKSDVTVGELMYRTRHVIQNELEVIHNKLMRHGITVLSGRGRLASAHEVEVVDASDGARPLSAEAIIIAAGSRPFRDPTVPFDDRLIFDSETILNLDRIPKSLVIVGGGIIGCEYACIFAHLGVAVTLIDSKPRLIPFLDHEISDALTHLMRKVGIKVILEDRKEALTAADNQVTIATRGGRTITAEKALFATGRVGNTVGMGLDRVGVPVDERGLIVVDENFHTGVEKIYAVGDIIGFPALASVSMDQGRLAARHAFGRSETRLNTLLPYGIYTIPEVSIVGETEAGLSGRGVPYETGTAHFYELARGQIAGDHDGLLKLIFCPHTHKLYGVHIIGQDAADLVHVGQAVISFNGTIDFFVDTVFNFPTMSEAYKVAALNGLANLHAADGSPRIGIDRKRKMS